MPAESPKKVCACVGKSCSRVKASEACKASELWAWGLRFAASGVASSFIIPTFMGVGPCVV